jgi:hypothetical protein
MRGVVEVMLVDTVVVSAVCHVPLVGMRLLLLVAVGLGTF